MRYLSHCSAFLNVSRTKTFVSNKAGAAGADHVSKPFRPKGEPGATHRPRGSFSSFYASFVGGR